MSDMYCMKLSFFSKRAAKREKLQGDASIMSNVMEINADDLDAQYKRVFKKEGKTGIINVTGPLSPDGPDWLDVYFGYFGTAYKNIIRAANESRSLADSGEIDNVKIIMNTPGGELDGLDQAYQALQKISDIGVVYNEGCIASAGVWLASAFSKIIPGTDSSQIGSIGVVIDTLDLSGYYDNFGIKEISITNTASPNKRPDISTDAGIEIYRKELNELYDVFVSKVTAARPITKKTIDSLKGEMVIASRAVELGLMDAPPAGETPEKVETVEKNNETEVSKLDNELKLTRTDEQFATDLAAAITDERARIAGLSTISGIELSDELKTAIETGTSTGNFAIAQTEAKNAAAKVEVEAQIALREKNKDQNIDIASNQHGEEIETTTDADGNVKANDKLEKMLDARYEKKGDKK